MALNETALTAEALSYPMWGFGLSEDDARLIADLAGTEYTLTNFAVSKAPMPGQSAQAPVLIWVDQAAWKSLPAAKRSAYLADDSSLRVLVQDEHANRPKDDELVADGFMTCVRAPLGGDMVRDVLRRARELSGLFDDIMAMAKEILLERELLERKTGQLEFLNRMLLRASESLDPKTILNRAREDISTIAPLRAMQAAFWRKTVHGLEVELYISPDLDPEEQSAWTAFLLDETSKHAKGQVFGFDTVLLESESGLDRADLGPPLSHETSVLPLSAANDTYGILAMVRQPGLRLGKDQTETIRSAINHLGLALNNALKFRDAQFKAEYDGLTRLHNRQGFDRRIQEELARHRRYGHPLSLLLLDLDFFKSINDTYGHEAGDLVLREVGRILSASLRNTDFPCRYGGEEFAIILPHTPVENAVTLAERLREAVAETIFHFQAVNFQITTSIGISALTPDVGDDELLGLADRALYDAKEAGRNTVRIAHPEGKSMPVDQAREELA